MNSKNDLKIKIPRSFLLVEMDTELRKKVLMSYCFLKRFSSIDGCYETSLNEIIKKYGLHCDASKTKVLPKQAKSFIAGLDYLCEHNIVRVENGDYHNIMQECVFKLNCEITNNNFMLLKIKDFDYILNNEKRINKMGLLYTLLFILNQNIIIDVNGEKNYCVACALSLDKFSEKLGFSKITTHKYLKNISIEEGYEGDAPLVKSRNWCIKINNQIIRFPSVFVENTPYASKVIEQKRKDIRSRFVSKDNENFDDYVDFDPSELY